MTSEDDTFRILSQSPFEVVQELLRYIPINILESRIHTEEFLLSCGWTIAEYDKRQREENEKRG